MKRFLLWIISVALGVVVLLAAVMGVSYAFTTEGGCPDGAAQFGGQALEANGSCWQVPRTRHAVSSALYSPFAGKRKFWYSPALPANSTSPAAFWMVRAV